MSVGHFACPGLASKRRETTRLFSASYVAAQVSGWGVGGHSRQPGRTAYRAPSGRRKLCAKSGVASASESSNLQHRGGWQNVLKQAQSGQLENPLRRVLPDQDRSLQRTHEPPSNLRRLWGDGSTQSEKPYAFSVLSPRTLPERSSIDRFFSSLSNAGSIPASVGTLSRSKAASPRRF